MLNPHTASKQDKVQYKQQKSINLNCIYCVEWIKWEQKHNLEDFVARMDTGTFDLDGKALLLLDIDSYLTCGID